LYRIEDGFHRLPLHWMWWPAIGAIVVGLGGLVDIRVLGAGYSNIQALVDGDLLVRAVIILLIVKALVWLVALGSGTSGGILAPLLILGGCAGFLIGEYLPGDPGFWAMIGMAGVMSGTMRAPMTGALFAAELTNHLSALPETIAAGTAAYAISVLILKRSILTEKIARRGRHILREYTVDALEFLQVSQLMTSNPATLPGKMPLSEAVAFFETQAQHRSYPVVDSRGRLLGLVSRTDALRWQVSEIPEGTLADALSDAATQYAYPETPTGEVADMMVESGIGRIPIVDPESRRVVGIISRQDLLKVRIRHKHVEKVRTRGTK
jgi:CBS domain-containing protein